MASGLSSSSTLAQVENAYDDNAVYAEERDLAKCRAFVVACRILLRRLPSVAVKGSNSISLRLESIQRELEEAQDWLEAHTTAEADVQSGPRITRSDVRNFRS